MHALEIEPGLSINNDLTYREVTPRAPVPELSPKASDLLLAFILLPELSPRASDLLRLAFVLLP